MKTKAASFAVIGLGTFGGTVASELTRFGNYVLGIDLDDANVSRYADDLSQAVIADGRDETALREAGVGQCDVAIVAIGEDLEANVLCSLNAKMIGVPVIWAKASTRSHHRILSKIGVDRVIHPEQEIGRHIAQVLHNPLVRDYLSLGNNRHVVNMVASKALAGSNLTSGKLFEAFDVRCLGVMRGTTFVGAAFEAGDVQEGDKLLLLGQRTALRSFADSLQT